MRGASACKGSCTAISTITPITTTPTFCRTALYGRGVIWAIWGSAGSFSSDARATSTKSLVRRLAFAGSGSQQRGHWRPRGRVSRELDPHIDVDEMLRRYIERRSRQLQDDRRPWRGPEPRSLDQQLVELELRAANPELV